MSKLKRYHIQGECTLNRAAEDKEDPDGEWCKADDVSELETKIDALEKERDAWRGATGLASLTPSEAGYQIDREDEERERLKKEAVEKDAEIEMLKSDCDHYARGHN